MAGSQDSQSQNAAPADSKDIRHAAIQMKDE